jgi:spore maturation protein CgeB
MAPISVYSLTSALACFPQYYGEISATLKKSVSVKIWEKLKYRKFAEECCRIALIDFGYFLTREIADAIMRSGHEVLKVPVHKEETGSRIVPRLMEGILRFRPDFFMTVNHLGFDEDGVLTDFFRAIEMPVVSWFVDSPSLILKAFDKNVSPYVSILLWDRSYTQEIRAMGFEHVEYLPLGTDEHAFRCDDRLLTPDRELLCEVGFVGNSMEVPVRERLSRVGKSLHPLVEQMARRSLSSKQPFDAKVAGLSKSDREHVTRLDPKERIDLEAAVLWKATQLYRLSCIRQVAAFDLRVHGDPGWKRLLENPRAHFPPLDYYSELPSFYRACAVNLNATNLQMGEAVNQRVFDVPVSGGFLLTDYQESLCELFEIGKEVVVFEAPEEVQDLVSYYLRKPELREDVARRARKSILDRHTYRHRLDQVLRHARSTYARR